MRHLKKIHYVPGLISACIIPILFWFYGNRKLNEPIPNVMDIGLPAKEIGKPNLSFEPYRNWDYKKILVKPNTARQNSDLYVSEIKKLQQRNEKKTGIEFIINDENSYDDLISILNDFIKTKQEYYTLDLGKTNHFFAMVNYKDPNQIDEPCTLCDDVVYEFYEPTLSENIQYRLQQLAKLPKETFYIIFGFLIFLNISMFSIKESFQNH